MALRNLGGLPRTELGLALCKADILLVVLLLWSVCCFFTLLLRLDHWPPLRIKKSTVTHGKLCGVGVAAFTRERARWQISSALSRQICRVRITQLYCSAVGKAVMGDMAVDGHGCVPKNVYLWTLKLKCT